MSNVKWVCGGRCSKVKRAWWYSTLLIIGAALALSASRSGAAAAAASSCSLEGIDRVVAIGDVHGAADRLADILRAAELIDAQQRWSGGRAHLVQLGDIVDRGPNSREALDMLRKLEREAASAGGAVHVLLGNHEVARMLGDMRLVVPGEYQAFVTPQSEELRKRAVESAPAADREQLLKDTPLGALEMHAAFGRDGVYGKWLRTLDSVVKINGVLFAHGGISPDVASRPCDEINATIRRELTGDFEKTRKAPLASLAARVDSPAWYRGLAEQPDSFAPQLDEILAKQKARAIVIAHTVAPDGRIRVRFGGKVVQIDTGMQRAYVPNGRPSAVELAGGHLTAIYEDRREQIGGPAAP